jgi:hypothetical protein
MKGIMMQKLRFCTAAICAFVLVAMVQPVDARKKRKAKPRHDIINMVMRDAQGVEHGTASLYQRGQEVRVELL